MSGSSTFFLFSFLLFFEYKSERNLSPSFHKMEKEKVEYQMVITKIVIDLVASLYYCQYTLHLYVGECLRIIQAKTLYG